MSVLKRNNVKGKLKWHKFPALSNPAMRKETIIQKGRKGFSAGDWTYVCSNHFIDGAPTGENPRPSLVLTPSDALQKTTQKRKHVERSDTPIGNNHQKISNEAIDDVDDRGEPSETSSSTCVAIFSFRDSDVRFYTGFINTDIFKTIFEHLLPKATDMNYWDGPMKTSFSPELDAMLSAYPRMRRGPSQKLTLEQEFFLVLIKLESWSAAIQFSPQIRDFTR